MGTNVWAHVWAHVRLNLLAQGMAAGEDIMWGHMLMQNRPCSILFVALACMDVKGATCG